MKTKIEEKELELASAIATGDSKRAHRLRNELTPLYLREELYGDSAPATVDISSDDEPYSVEVDL